MRRRACLALLLLLPVLTFCRSAAAADDLPRRGSLGVAVAPLPEDVRQAQKVEAGTGILVQDALPGSPAAEAGIRKGDVVVGLGGQKVAGVPQFLQLLSAVRAGETARLELVREGKPVTQEVRLRERPRETGEGFEVVYGSVPSRAGRLRTLVTLPPGEGRKPALLLLPGLGGFSQDNPPPADPYRQILHALTRAGYVTMRVEKPGIGDSEGGPHAESDFEAELDGYRQGLKRLKELPQVDAERVFLFGHSMGGVMAPILAGETPVRGVAVYGTVARTWHEYLLENLRRQLSLAGEDPGTIDRAVREESAIAGLLLDGRQTPEMVLAARPDLRPALEQRLAQGKLIFGRHYRFFQQLAALNPGALWSKPDTRVLSLWGKGDFVSSGEDHALIARVVNAARPGRAEYRALEGIDHGFKKAAGQEESFRARGAGPGEFHPLILESLRGWMDSLR